MRRLFQSMIVWNADQHGIHLLGYSPGAFQELEAVQLSVRLSYVEHDESYLSFHNPSSVASLHSA